jgi:hypothetical protein
MDKIVRINTTLSTAEFGKLSKLAQLWRVSRSQAASLLIQQARVKKGSARGKLRKVNLTLPAGDKEHLGEIAESWGAPKARALGRLIQEANVPIDEGEDL